MKLLKSFQTRFLYHPFLTGFLTALAAGLVLTLCLFVPAFPELRYDIADGISLLDIVQYLTLLVLMFLAMSGFLVYPLILTVSEILFFLWIPARPDFQKRSRSVDITAVVLAVPYSLLYLSLLKNVVFAADWPVTLYNLSRHTPLYTDALPTLLVIAAAAALGYITVNFIPLSKMPPLLMTVGLAAMYLGTLESILFGIQVFDLQTFELLDCLLLLFPLNCILITARTVFVKVREWKRFSPAFVPLKIGHVPVLNRLNSFLRNANCWPFAAFLLMWPLLGIFIGILLLFGQAPDSVIKAWTETSGWNLSRRVSPQNLAYDEHYLCTVAAGGHKRIVKPLRLGVRHGHEVIVNRQLCIANAFEQILEERLPRFHRLVRNFYDTFGFPVARLIKSRCIADMIYFLMKPLEWFFVLVLYLTDPRPESRIALQYTGKTLKDFSAG